MDLQVRRHAASRGIVVALLAWVWSTLATADEASRSCPGAGSSICEQARREVSRAEVAVAQASQARALWTTASDALHSAQTLFAAGDYEAAEQAARVAVEQATLGIAQTHYPAMPMPKQ